MSIFKKACEFVIRMEGGYVNNPLDPGKATRWGISQNSYPQLDIENLTQAEAINIYHKDYWKKLNLDALPSRLALVLFDSGINCGTKRAGIWLQIAINKLTGYRLRLDGQVGLKTLQALQLCEMWEVMCLILSFRLKHYAKQKGEFLKGWIIRIAQLLEEIAKE